MPNGTLDGFNHVLDFDERLTNVFRVTAIVFPAKRTVMSRRCVTSLSRAAISF
jgi:phage shock protein PspC (stress-responsive transcriptional regulator)